jgi:colanic acid/amylovoran biosynthesis protein
MLDRTGAAERDAYVGFLVHTVRQFGRHGAEPLLLCHGGQKDRAVAQLVEKELGSPLPASDESDPVRLKGIVGKSVALVGSRFHAIVGALSQGVPAIGTSWSHKYEALFDDYGCRELLVAPSAAKCEVDSLVARVCDASERNAIRGRLLSRAKAIRWQVDAMLNEVSRVLGVCGERG